MQAQATIELSPLPSLLAFTAELEARVQHPVHISASTPAAAYQEDLCFTCRKPTHGAWFARICLNGHTLVACSPSCAERCFDTLHPPTTDEEQSLASDELPLHFFVGTERPWL